MANTFFASPPFISHPISRTNHFSSSSQTPPPSPSPSQPPSQPSSQLPSPSSSSSGSRIPVSLRVQQQQKPASKTTAESTDWVASTLTRRFGLGAGLAWAGFLAIGVVSEQIKTRFEVSQQEANTRFLLYTNTITSIFLQFPFSVKLNGKYRERSFSWIGGHYEIRNQCIKWMSSPCYCIFLVEIENNKQDIEVNRERKKPK